MSENGSEGAPQQQVDVTKALKQENNVNTRKDRSNRFLPDRRPGWLDRAKGVLRGLAVAGVIAGGAVGADKATGSHVENAVTDTATAVGQSAEQISEAIRNEEIVLKPKVRVEILDGVEGKPVIRTSPRADTVDNQLNEEQSQQFSHKQVEGSVVLGGRWYAGASEDERRWVKFKRINENGDKEYAYVASSLVNELPEQEQ